MQNEKKAVGMSQNVCVKEASVRNRKLEAEKASQNQEPREQVRRSRRENKGRMQPPKTAPLSLLSSCPPHQLTQLKKVNIS